jgi:hypothetical protein
MSATPTPTHFTIRDLPLPAKIVITCFLLAVGGGYTAAMVQLHFQDSKSGEAMPTVHDVVLKFTGKKWFETDPPRPVSKLEKLVMGPIEGAPWNGSGSMAPAFFAKDGGSYNRAIKEKPGEKERIDAERNGEREALTLWMNAPADVRKKAYEEDKFHVPADKPITGEYRLPDGSVKVKTILFDRCERCHGKGADQEKMPLETYDQVAKYMEVPGSLSVPPGGGWVKIEEPISLEKLTQSTHAHLLSFAMLFSLTGLVFAFSSYPLALRCILGPWVLLAVVADVTLWWLARLSDGKCGPYFAMAIIGTGGAAGMGLAAQITLGVFNMYGRTGKCLIALVFLLGAGCLGLVYLNQIEPGLAKKKEKLLARLEGEKKPEETKPAPQPAPPAKNDPAPTPKGPVVAPPKKEPVAVTPAGESRMEKHLRLPVKDAAGQETPLLKIPFKGNQDGGMVRAFFDKDGADFAQAVKDKDKEALGKLEAERHNELAAFLAWMRMVESDRRKAYEMDAFDLPAGLTGKPFTADYLVGGKVKVKKLLNDRCTRCHTEGSDAEKYPFDNYDKLRELMLPGK